MKKTKIAIISFCLLFVGGCSNSIGSAPETTHSGFDGATIVVINGHGNGGSSMIASGLGARWSSKRPDDAVLVVYVFNDITAITGAQLNIDGEIYHLKGSETFTKFDADTVNRITVKESRKGFHVPLDLISKITKSSKTWLRVQTTKGLIEDPVVDGSNDSKAFHALKRFLVAVEAA